MDRKEIVNSQEYKATKAAIKWWYSLPEEQRKATDIDAEPDIVDAYAEGVIYGWNNPHWIPVEEELPKVDDCGNSDFYLVHDFGESDHVAYYCKTDNEWYTEYGESVFPTHWMPIVPPRKEE